VFEEPVDDETEKKVLELSARSSNAPTPLPLTVWRMTPQMNRERQLVLPNRMPEARRPNRLSAPKDIQEMFEQIDAALGKMQR